MREALLKAKVVSDADVERLKDKERAIQTAAAGRRQIQHKRQEEGRRLREAGDRLRRKAMNLVRPEIQKLLDETMGPPKGRIDTLIRQDVVEIRTAFEVESILAELAAKSDD